MKLHDEHIEAVEELIKRYESLVTTDFFSMTDKINKGDVLCEKTGFGANCFLCETAFSIEDKEINSCYNCIYNFDSTVPVSAMCKLNKFAVSYENIFVAITVGTAKDVVTACKRRARILRGLLVRYKTMY